MQAGWATSIQVVCGMLLVCSGVAARSSLLAGQWIECWSALYHRFADCRT